MIPMGLGAMGTMPLAGTFMDKRGPGRVVLVGLSLIGAGMGTFAYGAATQAAYLPTLLAGLVIMGMGMGCTMIRYPARWCRLWLRIRSRGVRR